MLACARSKPIWSRTRVARAPGGTRRGYGLSSDWSRDWFARFFRANGAAVRIDVAHIQISRARDARGTSTARRTARGGARHVSRRASCRRLSPSEGARHRVARRAIGGRTRVAWKRRTPCRGASTAHQARGRDRRRSAGRNAGAGERADCRGCVSRRSGATGARSISACVCKVMHKMISKLAALADRGHFRP